MKQKAREMAATTRLETLKVFTTESTEDTQSPKGRGSGSAFLDPLMGHALDVAIAVLLRIRALTPPRPSLYY